MNRFVLRAARVATPTEILDDGFVVVEGGQVGEVGRGRPPSRQEVTDLGDRLIAPGYVDVHVHGGGGAQVNCGSEEQVEASVRRMARFHATHGTTSLVATTVSDDQEALCRGVEGVLAVARSGRTDGGLPGDGRPGDGRPGNGGLGAHVLGSNLEGPWISPARAGAQYVGALRLPSLDELRELVKRSEGTVRLLTIAPELDGAMEVIAAARSLDVVVSIGHTGADYETAVAAFEAGARHATHLFNAMAPIHHRQPGPVAAALNDDRIFLEIIADGVHIHPALISLVAHLAPERLVLVTDAIGATGSPPGRYRLGPVEVLVSEGKAVLADRKETVAGSVLTMDAAVALAVRVAGVPLLTALRAASLHPAQALGEHGKGRLLPGADADMVVLDNDLSLAATIIGGQPAYDPTGLMGGMLPSVVEAPAP